MKSLPEIFRFRLFVAGTSPNSALAIVNLNAICRAYLPNQHHIELVDVLQDPRRALDAGVMLTPKLVKLSPSPSCEIIGTLSHEDTVINALGLPK